MHRLRVIVPAGDTLVEWATAEDTAVKEAEKIFDEARARGATAIEISEGGEPRVLEHFAPEAETIVMVPCVAGG